MGEISIISATSVAPASTKNPATIIQLTPWELQFLPFGPIQKGLLFHNPELLPSEPSHGIVVDRLRTSLSRTLDSFYPLAGCIGTTAEDDDDTTRFFLKCNGAGALFIHASAEGVTVGDIIEPVYVPLIIRSFFPLNGVRNSDGVSQPLLAVQVTELVDGIFIGCTVNHSVADGASFWHFFNSWSEISRGSGEITSPPVFDRCFLDEFHYPVPIPRSMLAFNPLPPSPFQEKVFHFTKENIAVLKSKANSEMSTGQISSLQALLSHLWRSMTRCRRIPVDQETHFKFLIGMRSRMSPPLPEQYFGAAAQLGTVTMKAGELLDCGLGHAAWKMNRMIAAGGTASEAINFLELWMKTPPDPATIVIVNNSYAASSSPRFNVYGADFGWGKPVAVRSGGANKFCGKTTLFPGSEEGSIDIELCLPPETFEGMVGDVEFREALSI